MAHTITRLGRGSDSQIGWKKEATYGTSAAPVNAFAEAFNIGLAPRQETIKSKGWKPGLRGPRHNMRVPWNRGGEGTVGLEVKQNGYLGLFQWAIGGTNTCAQQGGTVAYDGLVFTL